MDKKKYFKTHRIYSICIPTVTTLAKKKLILPKGMMAAQAAHAASKAKFAHVLRQKSTDSWVKAFHENGMTTILLEARDVKELFHIAKLAQAKSLPFEYFGDDNASFYGDNESYVTALAIGPILKDDSKDVCDYLPKFE